MKTFAEVREILNRIRYVIGRQQAVNIIREHGQAYSLAELDERLYDFVYQKAEEFWFRYHGVPGELQRAAHRLDGVRYALNRMMEQMMSVKDDLNAAVDGAVSEMQKAGDFIRNHPASNSDPELKALADRLTAASTALGGVDVEQVVANPTAQGTGTG